MNTIVTSKEAILAECRAIVMEKGISSINMRSVAAACGVAVGSLYNYFPSKDVYKRQSEGAVQGRQLSLILEG